MESLEYYLQKISSLESGKEKLKELYSFVQECKLKVVKTDEVMSEIIISGERMDEGLIGEPLLSKLSDICDCLHILMRESNDLIDQYNDMYSNAMYLQSLASEQEQNIQL